MQHSDRETQQRPEKINKNPTYQGEGLAWQERHGPVANSLQIYTKKILTH
jgi:hypothetical protein